MLETIALSVALIVGFGIGYRVREHLFQKQHLEHRLFS